MNTFWQFARQMLHYKTQLVVAMIAALFDAACAFGGFGTLMYVVDQFLGKKVTLYQRLSEQLSNPDVQKWIGDQHHLLDSLPKDILDDRFGGFAACMVVVLILTILGSAARFLHQYLTITVSYRAVMRVRRGTFQRLVHLPMDVLAEAGTADNLSRIVQDCNRLSRGFNALTGRTVRNLLHGVVFLVLAMVFDWALTLIFLLALPIIAILLRKFGKHIRRAAKRALQQYGVMLGSITESMLAIRVVKVNQAEGYERRRFNQVNRRVFAQEMKARVVRALAAPVIETMAIIGVVVVALIAAWYVFTYDLEPAQVIKVLFALGMAGQQFRLLANLNNDLQDASGAAQRLDELIHKPVEPDTIHHTGLRRRRMPRHHNKVHFDDVTFTYPTAEHPALRDIQLAVPFGNVCAIVGGNGSGKSTLLSLLPGLYSPQIGRVLIDGRDVAEHSLRSVRRQMAVVTQDTVLFDGTIADNIRYGQRHADDQTIIDAAKQAHAHEFIMQLPDGYDASVGEWGGRLSGGQKQRIAIARAIMRDPAILILDEATSQIDTESEANINEALAEFTKNRTTFVIAHRLSTVVGADMIVVMDDGRIESVGTHEQLLLTSDVYRVLCRTQFHAIPDSDMT